MTVCDALSTANGTSVILPGAVTPQKNSNDENTQLYPVHPFRLFGVGKPNLALAVNTYLHRPFPCNKGWCQDILDAAMLGLTTEAELLVQQRALAPPADGWRFPGFAPHEQVRLCAVTPP